MKKSDFTAKIEQHHQSVRESSDMLLRGNERIDVLVEAAYTLRHSDTVYSKQISEQALELANRNNYQRGRAFALRNMGLCLIYTDSYEQAGRVLEESRKLFVHLNDDAGLASVLNALGETQKSLGNHSLALKEYSAAALLYQKIGDGIKTAAVLNNLGSLHSRFGEYSIALDFYHQALPKAAESAAPLIQTQIGINLSDVLWQIGEANTAIGNLQQIIKYLEKLPNPRNTGVAYLNLGAAQQSRQDFQSALENYQRSLELAKAVDGSEVAAEAHYRIGDLYLEQGDQQNALTSLSESLDLARKIGNVFYEGKTSLSLGVAYTQVGATNQSGAMLNRALEICEQLNLKELRGKVHLALSKNYQQQGDSTAALFHHQAFHQDWLEVYGLSASRSIQKVLFKQSNKVAWYKSLSLGNPQTKNERAVQTALSPRKLRQITDFVNQRLETEISLTELANAADLSQSHFSRLFKQSVGKTPHQFLLEQRIERAKTLLQTTNLPLSEVALRCGFSSQSHLTTQFRFLTGTTPRLFRNY